MRNQLICLIFLFGLISACGDGGTNCEGDPNNGTFSFQLDGVDWTANTVAGVISQTVSPQSGETVETLTLTATDCSSAKLILTITDVANGSDGCIEVADYNQNGALNDCDTISPGNLECSSMQGTYLQDIVNQYFTDNTGTASGKVTISSCNASSRRIAGSFSFEVSSSGTNAETRTVSSGSFSNVLFTVQ